MAPRVDARSEPLAVPVRRWWTRLSSAHILIFAAAALAFTANLAVLRPSEAPPTVAVASFDLLPGTVFDPAAHVEFVPLTTDIEVLSRMVTGAAAASFEGDVLVSRVSAGSVLGLDALAPSATADGRRLMSLPVDMERAAGGTILAGDRVDVITVEEGTARYVAAALEVVRVPESGSGTFSAGSYHVVVAVDADAALRLATAMNRSAIQIIRSTGAPPSSVPPAEPADHD